MRRAAFSCAPILAMLCTSAFARGVTPYLPLSLDPEMERQVERVLILADQPVLTRPIPAAAVLDALPAACEKDADLCAQVRRYLSRYMDSMGIGHLSLEAAATSGDHALPNRYGMDNSSAWQASASLYWQPSDFLLVNLGGIAYDGETMAAGSFVSMGFSYAQLDVGYRSQWLSPFTDSSMLLGTQAPSMASATLSNYTPMTRLGLRYELMLARMSTSDRIRFEDGFTSGKPRLVGMHLSMQPAAGWSLGVNRLMQFGGGERGGNSIRDVLRAFFRPGRFDNSGPDLSRDAEFGNQVASITSRFIFPARTPFSVYLEYAGEDTSRRRSYLLGNSALSAGIEFPKLWRDFDLAYEVSEWQNGWYVNSIYQDGLTSEGHVLGHWGADDRRFGDGVGAQSHMLRLGWRPSSGGSLELRYRTLDNESYSAVRYERAHDVALRYTYPLSAFSVGAEATAGRDSFGEDYSRFALFVRLSERGERAALAEDYSGAPRPEGAELFVDAGLNLNDVTIDLERDTPTSKTGWSAAPHFAIGARRAISAHNDLGVRMELDDIDGNLLIGFRALDYRYRFDGPLAVGAFLGAARYDLATPAYGIYGGLGAQWRNLMPGWDLGVDLRYAIKVARDRLLPTDPPGERSDLFYDITSATLSVSRRF